MQNKGAYIHPYRYHQTKETAPSTQPSSATKTRKTQPVTIPVTDADFEPLRYSPLSSKFYTNIGTSVQEYATIAATHPK